MPAIVPVLVLILLSFSGCAAPFIEHSGPIEPGSRLFSLSIDGREREYLLHLPPKSVCEGPLPLVVVFHGYASSARSTERGTGMSDKADREGFIAVYPQAAGFIRTTWNAGFCCGDAYLQGVADLKFFKKLIETLRSNLNIDSARIYVAGFSNGGMMAYSIATQMPNAIAAIAVVSATAGIRSVESHNARSIPAPLVSVPLIGFHGMKDRHIPYHGGEGKRTKDVLEFYSVAQSLAFWISANGCEKIPARDTMRDGTVDKDSYACQDHEDIVFYSLRDGGHAWPVDGDCSGEGKCVSATDVIWEFFRAHPKRNNVSGADAPKAITPEVSMNKSGM